MGTPATGAERLRARLRLSAAGLLLAYASWIPLSWALATAAPFGVQQPREAALFLRWLSALGIEATGWAQGTSAVADESLRLVLWGVWCLLATASAGLALHALSRARPALIEAAAALPFLRRSALAAVGLCVFAYPVFTQDMWMGVAWGRMAAAGVNPYHVPFTEAALAGLPMDRFELRFTYGPLWAWVCAAIGLTSRGGAFLGLAAMKLVLLACWLIALRAVERLSDGDARRQAVALVLFGWLPVSPLLAVAEAHNDVALVVGLLGWLVLARRGSSWAALPLAASVLVKYVTLPFLAVEAWRSLGPGSRSRRAGAVALAAAALLMLAAALPFLGDGSIFGGTDRMGFRVLSPGKALATLTQVLPGPQLGSRSARWLLLGGVGLALLPLAWRFARGSDFHALLRLAFAALLAAAVVGTGHTWPWYLIWPLGVGVLIWDTALFRGSLSLFLAIPFFQLFWLQEEAWSGADPWGLGLWAFVVVTAWPCSRLLSPEPSPDETTALGPEP